MEILSFLTGAISTAFAFALFTSDYDEELDEELEEENEAGHTGRTVVLTCQTCRKLQNHLEIEPNLYRCKKCGRYVDLR